VTAVTVRLTEATGDQLRCPRCVLDFPAREIQLCAAHVDAPPPAPKRCAGVTFPTGSTQCWKPPVWAVYDTHHGGPPDRYACDRHLHNAVDRERGALVVPADCH
jgi:hypothetical protein